jgi:hypothetical protein
VGYQTVASLNCRDLRGGPAVGEEMLLAIVEDLLARSQIHGCPTCERHLALQSVRGAIRMLRLQAERDHAEPPDLDSFNLWRRYAESPDADPTVSAERQTPDTPAVPAKKSAGKRRRKR